MRILFFILMMCYNTFCIAQKYYIKTYIPLNLEFKGINDMCLQGENIVFRAGGYLPTGGKDTAIIGRFSTIKGSMLDVKKLDSVQFGLSLLESENDYIFPSYEGGYLKNISVSLINHDFKLKKSVDLKLPHKRYFDYFVREAIQFGDKSVISAKVVDTLNQYKWNGAMQCREKLVLFVVDKQLNLDTSFLIAPNNNSYWMGINGLGVFADSILYVSIFDRGPGFERKAIYGYNKQFKKVFSWISPDITDYLPARSSLTIDKNNTIYTAFYADDSRTYLYAIDSKGKKKWECPFDSTMVKGGWFDFNLMISKDGSILGSAVRSSAMDDLGDCTYIFKISPQGQMLWQKILRINKGFNVYTSATDYGLSTYPAKILELPNSDIVVGGEYQNILGKNHPLGPYSHDLFIARVDSTGCLWKDCPFIQDVVQKQKYLPIVTSRNEKVIQEIDGIKPFSTKSYSYTSDSFLLGNKYYFKSRSRDNNMGSGAWIEGGAYYREQNGIVYVKNGATVPEEILYNFNLGVGDTMPPLTGAAKLRIVGKVSTVKYLDGIPRKVMRMAKPCDQIFVVEGIGDIVYSSYSKCDPLLETNFGLRCFYTDGKAVIKPSGNEGCYTILAVKDVDPRIGNIYPNPSTGLLNIDIEDQLSIKNIFLTDNLGRTMHINEQISTDNGIQLNLEYLQNGMYHGNIIFNDGSKTKFKIIKVSE
jgi:hypothetical protein